MWHLYKTSSSYIRHQQPFIPLCPSPMLYGFFHLGPANFWLTLILAVFLIIVAIVTGICVGIPMTAPHPPSVLWFTKRITGLRGICIQDSAKGEDPGAGLRDLPKHPSGSLSAGGLTQHVLLPPAPEHSNHGSASIFRRSVYTCSFHLTSRSFSCSAFIICFLFMGRMQCGVAHRGRLAALTLIATTVPEISTWGWSFGNSLSPCFIIVSPLHRESPVFISLRSFKWKKLLHCSVKNLGKPTYYG